MCCKWNILLIIGLLIILGTGSPAWGVHGGRGDKKGAHNQRVSGFKRLVCTYCHFPKKGKGARIWSDNPLGAQTFPGAKGVKTICSSCHYPGNAMNALSGYIMGLHEDEGHDFSNGNVLCDTTLLSIGENHVMSEQVELDPQVGKLHNALDSTFPLRTKGEENKEGKDQAAKTGEFTCTTCHNPHNQPNKDISGNGDYLRVGKKKFAGESNSRTLFCLQCHEDRSEDGALQKVQHGGSIGCSECHHPHDGFYQTEQIAGLARTILIQEVTPVNFRALPNVAAFGSLPNDTKDTKDVQDTPDIDQDVSALCYACHGPTASDEMSEAGATPRFGDNCDTPQEHHPMGSQAQLGKSPRAPGLQTASLNNWEQVTCTSCHTYFHRGNNLYFLRKDFTNDDSTLCTSCHTNKTADGLGTPGRAHNQVAGESLNQRGQCMFCHFIHDGPDRGNQQMPSVNTLLRVEPINLAWSDQISNTHKEDFEDLCFGCHGTQCYMGGSGKQGARLQIEEYFSHRFSSVPSEKIQATFPISDGDSDKVLDDYGVAEGKIYCGSCHDIHKSSNMPYLRGEDSPYVSDAYCTKCHVLSLYGRSSHPTGVSPRQGVTIEKFPEILYGGKSGENRGITSDESATGQVLCLTCHNMHAAKTNFDGRLDSAGAGDEESGTHGKLLVVDNFSSSAGSDLCRSCHSPNHNIVESRHDFSGRDLGAPSKGVCAVCHIPHNSPEENRLWARNLAEEREGFSQAEKPNYRKGITLMCYDCHDDHFYIDDDPPVSGFLYPPQDIAFSDGPGRTSKIGFYETIPPGSLGENGVKNPPADGKETGGHYIKTTGLIESIDGINTGDKLVCSICHNPHKVTQNEVFLRTPPGENVLHSFEASKNTRNGTGTGREICASCHGYSEENILINTQLFDSILGFEILGTPSQDQIELAAHRKNAYDTSCTDCHVHNRMAIPEAQRSGPEAHDFHFQSLLAEGEGSIMSKRGKISGVEISEKKCDICHSPDLFYRDGSLVFIDGKTFDKTTVCDICHSKEGTYDGVNGLFEGISDLDHGAKDCWKNGVYDKTVNEDGDIERQVLKDKKDAWCVGCHDNQPSRIKNPDLSEHLWVKAPNVAGDTGRTYGFEVSGHGLPSAFTYQQSGRSGASLKCTDCHNPAEDHIVNERREKGNYLNWQNGGRYGYRLKLPLVLPRRTEAYHGSDFKLCFSCHNEASIIGLPPGYNDYTNNQSDYKNMKDYSVARFSNADERGIYPPRIMGRGIVIDFSKIFPNNSYNVHWNHLSLPNAELPEEAVISPQTQDSGSLQRTQSCYSSRCHGGTGIIKLRPNSFWDSDRDGVLDSRPSCVACHNPHGSRYVSMTRNDLAITHNGSRDDWEYGFIGSKEYGAYTDSLDNYNDLYCGECHAQLQRSGGSVIYYPEPLTGDHLPPASPK